MRQPRLLSLLVAVTAIFASSVAVASPMILGGTWSTPSDSTLTIAILVTGDPGDPIFDSGTFEHLGGGDAFSGANLALTIGDQTSGPTIKSVDLTGPGTLFHENNTGAQYIIQNPRQVLITTTTTAGYVGPNGVLAYVELDTTGIGCGQWDLLLSLPELSQTSDLPPYAPVGQGVNYMSDVIIQNGILFGCPEPSSIALAGLGILGLVACAWRNSAPRPSK